MKTQIKRTLGLLAFIVPLLLITFSISDAQSVYDDEFSSTSLDTKWHWIREDPTHWSLSARPGFLRIITQNSDIWEEHNNAPILLQDLQPSTHDNFILRTRVALVPQENYHQGGLVIYQDDDNYVRFTYLVGPGFEFAKEIHGEFSHIWTTAPENVNDFHLKIIKIGMDYSAYYSLDGNDWTLVGTLNSVNITPHQIGLTAFGAGSEIEIPADFDYFHLTELNNRLYLPIILSNNHCVMDNMDNFDSTELRSEWYWIREDPTHWSLSARPGFLRIITQNSAIWGDTNNAPILLQQLQPSTQESFVLRTRIVLEPQENFQQGGLIIYQDDDNYVKLTYTYINGPAFEFNKELQQNYSNVVADAPENVNDFHLKIIKIGMNYTGYYSLDGNDWTLIGAWNSVNITPNQIGLTAFGPGSEIEIPADFDYFQYCR